MGLRRVNVGFRHFTGGTNYTFTGGAYKSVSLLIDTTGGGTVVLNAPNAPAGFQTMTIPAGKQLTITISGWGGDNIDEFSISVSAGAEVFCVIYI